MTMFISPIKLYEYLSIGKPIVSTNLPEVQNYSEHVLIAEEPQGFIKLIEDALQGESSTQVINRRNFAKQHSWEARLEIILPVISETLREKNNAAN
jgi:hypothetical protein